MRLTGVLLFTLAAQFMTVIMLGASIAPGYDVNGGAISDLGVIGETALLFNVSLVVVGVLNVVAGLLLYSASGRRTILAVFGVAGLGAFGAGLVSLEVSGLHGIFALAAFLFFNIEAILTGAVVSGPMRAVSWIAGLIGDRIRRAHGHRRRRQSRRLRSHRPRWCRADDRVPGDALADGLRRLPDGCRAGEAIGLPGLAATEQRGHLGGDHEILARGHDQHGRRSGEQHSIWGELGIARAVPRRPGHTDGAETAEDP